MINISVKVATKGPSASARLKKIETALTTGPKAVKVGFPAGKAPGDLISIAYWNHEGTSRGIPPRPFITMAMYKGRHRLRAELTTMTRGLLAGKSDLKAGLTKLGMLGQDMIQVQIGSNMPPPNKPATIKAKGSSRTLVDTGRMAQSVTWDFDK